MTMHDLYAPADGKNSEHAPITNGELIGLLPEKAGEHWKTLLESQAILRLRWQEKLGPTATSLPFEKMTHELIENLGEEGSEYDVELSDESKESLVDKYGELFGGIIVGYARYYGEDKLAEIENIVSKYGEVFLAFEQSVNAHAEREDIKKLKQDFESARDALGGDDVLPLESFGLGGNKCYTATASPQGGFGLMANAVRVKLTSTSAFSNSSIDVCINQVVKQPDLPDHEHMHIANALASVGAGTVVSIYLPGGSTTKDREETREKLAALMVDLESKGYEGTEIFEQMKADPNKIPIVSNVLEQSNRQTLDRVMTVLKAAEEAPFVKAGTDYDEVSLSLKVGESAEIGDGSYQVDCYYNRFGMDKCSAGNASGPGGKRFWTGAALLIGNYKLTNAISWFSNPAD